MALFKEIPRIQTMTISQETRLEAFESTDTASLQRAVMDLVFDHPEGLSPWQAWELMGQKHALWALRPRFTELRQLGLIRVAGKRKGPTGKSEAFYQRVQQVEYDSTGQGLLFEGAA